MKKWIAVALIVCVAGFVQAAEKKGKGKHAPKPQTCEQFVAAAQKKAEKDGKDFDKAKCEKMFAKLDADSDGTVTPEERKAGQKGKGKGKKKK
ncbi:MAG: hypothetical protein K9M45_09635 [Kiritimatiellales bacterium]|nr:hypothetical protein [Kiritimatiellales bacterium]